MGRIAHGAAALALLALAVACLIGLAAPRPLAGDLAGDSSGDLAGGAPDTEALCQSVLCMVAIN